MAAEENVAEVIERSDQLFRQRKIEESFDLLTPYADDGSDNPEVLWRVIRMYHSRSRDLQLSNKKEAEKLANKGFELAQKALAVGADNAGCNKFAGAIITLHTDLKIFNWKEKIDNSYKVKALFEKAIELDPKDMAARHMLGRWHFVVAAIPAPLRVVLKNVPNSTFEEALTHFQAAEELNGEDKYPINWLYLGKTLVLLKNKIEAKPWLTKVIESEDSYKEALEAKAEAQKFLKRTQ